MQGILQTDIEEVQAAREGSKQEFFISNLIECCSCFISMSKMVQFFRLEPFHLRAIC